MKKILISIFFLFMLTSCDNNPSKTVERKVDKYLYIETLPWNGSLNNISNEDTLKINIFDSNVVNLIEPSLEFVTVLGNLNDSKGVRNTWVNEDITSDLHIERNPIKSNELWVFGFQPNLDSKRKKLDSRFYRYGVILKYSELDPYFTDCGFSIEVFSASE